MVFKTKKIGILGGSFDPAHIGHLAISKEAIKRFKLQKVIWAITEKNPLKKKSITNLKLRIKSCRRIIKKNKLINVKFYEKIIKSNRTIDLINYISKNKKIELYFLMGADNLINFHRWYKWKSISQKCIILVFDRHRYKKKSLNSKTFKSIDNRRIKFIKFNKVNISSSKLRKI
ncbi:nicotinate (nicotinamide) nucleotide adenylyltransferase [Candidatus Pelagibacter sp.]|nr:nicotinate (nicotinamide) nucleotide adenylyltransferase [Candidatus Pelagibacter sp.]